ncbi:MAG: tyrosine-type recombinase/integrase, partial [Mycoplasmataceae bacterium]|nr:tyrosine-type recombinase/integrase [Mycoplasmataceae bacterium]
GDKTPYIFHPIRNNSHKTLEKPLSTSYIFELIKKMTSEVIPNKKFSPHSLRKTFIELALNNGDNFISICNATGHSTVEMIKYYDTRDKLKNNSIHSLSKLL